MKRHLPRLVLLSLLLALPLAASACGEGMFMAGKGLQFQSYLAPRPATVLIFAPEADGRRQAVYAGLQKAGHQLTLVSSEAGLDEALLAGGYDVLIADLDRLEALGTRASRTHLLPVVPRELRRSRDLVARFERFVVDGASLGQHLSAIDDLVAMK